mmetsp:Transcript_5884/g.8552  ORF Transcript_5884/g.8552 Transcript_5884/m.8552 type:complete len:100 (-) Transcript_5884:485-784(-)
MFFKSTNSCNFHWNSAFWFMHGRSLLHNDFHVVEPILLSFWVPLSYLFYFSNNMCRNHSSSHLPSAMWRGLSVVVALFCDSIVNRTLLLRFLHILLPIT